MHLHIEFAVGLRLDVGTSFMFVFSRRRWNSQPVNSPPLSWMHLFGHGYLANQLWANLSLMCWDVFLSILTISTRFVTVSMLVKALNSYSSLFNLIFHGPMRSTATSSKGSVRVSRSGNRPYPLPSSLCRSQCMHLYWSTYLRSSGWYYPWLIVNWSFFCPGWPVTRWNHTTVGLTITFGNVIRHCVLGLSPSLT